MNSTQETPENIDPILDTPPRARLNWPSGRRQRLPHEISVAVADEDFEGLRRVCYRRRICRQDLLLEIIRRYLKSWSARNTDGNEQET
jgi:hypothetical protein